MTEPLKTYVGLFGRTSEHLKETLAMKNKYVRILHKVILSVPKDALEPDLNVEIIDLLAEDMVMREKTEKFLDEVILTLEEVKQ